jgi:hypothetical protein
MPSARTRGHRGWPAPVDEQTLITGGLEMDARHTSSEGPIFKKSSLSSKDNPQHCVAVSSYQGRILVCHSMQAETTLEFTPEEWKAFVEGVRAGEFDFEA